MILKQKEVVIMGDKSPKNKEKKKKKKLKDNKKNVAAPISSPQEKAKKPK